MEPYRSYYPHAGLMLPATEKLVERVLILPTGMAVRESEVAEVCRILKLAIDNAIEVRRYLSDVPPEPDDGRFTAARPDQS
jgi:hypothetical protein